MQLYSLVRRHFAASLLLLLVANLLVIRQMSKDKEALHNSDSPKGIISLELVTQDAHQQRIIESWANTPVEGSNMTALQVAQRQTRIDYLFILLYTALFCLLLIRLAPVRKRELWIRTAVSLAVAAGLLDCLENISMMRAMNDATVPSWQIWMPSAAKWMLVFFMSGVILIQSIYQLYALLLKRMTERKSIKQAT